MCQKTDQYCQSVWIGCNLKNPTGLLVSSVQRMVVVHGLSHECTLEDLEERVRRLEIDRGFAVNPDGTCTGSKSLPGAHVQTAANNRRHTPVKMGYAIIT